MGQASGLLCMDKGDEIHHACNGVIEVSVRTRETCALVGTFARVVVCNGPARVLNVETRIREREYKENYDE